MDILYKTRSLVDQSKSDDIAYDLYLCAAHTYVPFKTNPQDTWLSGHGSIAHFWVSEWVAYASPRHSDYSTCRPGALKQEDKRREHICTLMITILPGFEYQSLVEVSTPIRVSS